MRPVIACFISSLVNAGLIGCLGLVSGETPGLAAPRRGEAAVELLSGRFAPPGSPAPMRFALARDSTEPASAPQPSTATRPDKQTPPAPRPRSSHAIAEKAKNPSPPPRILPASLQRAHAAAASTAPRRAIGPLNPAKKRAAAPGQTATGKALSNSLAGAGAEVLAKPVPSNQPPLYPPEHLAAGREGLVVLRVLVGADGIARSLRVARSSGLESMDRAALAAVRQWRFQPARRAGLPVACEVNVPIRFDYRPR